MLCTAAASLLVGGCAGNGADLDANGQPLEPGAPGSGPLTADFDSIQANVFTLICTVCHAGADAPHGLRLDAADSYGLLVGVPSVEVTSLLRVEAGDPDDSYLIQKLEGHAAVGARMPLGGPYLSNDVIALIRQWITAGAPHSTSNAATAAFTLIAVAPAAGDVLFEAPAQVMIAFNHELDTTRIDRESVRIERRDGQGADAQMRWVPSCIGVPTGNVRTLLVWPLQPLRDGHYQVVLRVSPALTDIAGAARQPAAQAFEEAGDSRDEIISTFDVGTVP
jgi:methionine-rich copper-binding protein CopC